MLKKGEEGLLCLYDSYITDWRQLTIISDITFQVNTLAECFDTGTICLVVFEGWYFVHGYKLLCHLHKTVMVMVI